jgi:hypothetical protein
MTSTFDDLVRSRKEWIQAQLIPWCRAARLADLKKAEHEWGDIAGRISPEFSLWLWAWSRFPHLYVEGMRGLEETNLVTLELRSGEQVSGYPDARASQRGTIVLLHPEGQSLGPFSLDDVQQVSLSS